MNRAESLAKTRGCFMAFVNTTLSRTPGFYEKIGYKLIETFEGYPFNGDKYFFYAKRLAA